MDMVGHDFGNIPRRALGLALAVLVAILCTISLAHAQATNSGDIRGVVMDASGAVIPGAAVTVRDVNTGFTKNLTTNSAGLYDTASILPGNYTVTVSKQGFQTYVRSNLIVQAAIPMTVNATLTVGATTQTVQVTSQSPLLKTENAAQGSSLAGHTMTELPNVTRSWTNYLSLIPGTVTAAPYASAWSMNINGTMPDYASFLSDGGSVTSPHGTAMLAPVSFAAVAEVQVSTSTYSAEYGNGGAVVNQITKSGTNKYHGELYDFEQNTSLNARSFFQSGVGLRHYHNFGGSFGGPIVHNKAFFFVNVDKTLNGSNYTSYHTVPTLDERNGNFSQKDPNTGAALFPTIYYPTNSANAGTPIPGNNLGNTTLPMDTLAAAYQKYFPAPNLFYSNGDPLTVNNRVDVLSSSSPIIQIFGRVDYDISNRNRLTISAQKYNNPSGGPGYIYPIDSYAFVTRSYQAQISDVWTFSPTLINEARIGFIKGFNGAVSYDLGLNYPQKLGWTYSLGNLPPMVGISGTPGYSIGQNVNDSVYNEYTWTPSDAVTLIKGRHILHFGGEVLYFADNDTPWGYLNPGAFTFSGAYTESAPLSGNGGFGYADFLLGDVSQWSGSVSPINGMRQYNPQFFFQDDFKVTPRLTVNLGVRYQIQTGWREKHNNLGSFDPNIVNPNSYTDAAGNTVPAGTLGAMWFAPQNGRNTQEKTVWNLFLPRLGFAWNFKPSWVVRGGFGIYSYLWSEDFYANGAGLGNTTSGFLQDTSGAHPVFQFDATNPTLNLVTASRQPGAYNGQSVSYTPYNTPVSRSYQWSLEVQKEFPHNMVASIKYIGNHTKGLPWAADTNQIPESALGLPATLADPQSARPFPQFADFNGTQPTGVSPYNSVSNYNAMEVDIRKRTSAGLTFGTQFTWSHMLNNEDSAGWCCQYGTATWQDAYNPAVNYGPSQNDRRWVTSEYAVYQLPVGHGKQFLNTQGPADWVLGGWQLSSVFYWESGDHFTPVMAVGNNSLAGYWYPNVVGDWKSGGGTIDQWFNPAAFAEPTMTLQDGTVVPNPNVFGNAGRNILVGPSQSRLDFSLAKSFAIPLLGEAGRFQIRMDADNAINHPSFSDPQAPGGNSGLTLIGLVGTGEPGAASAGGSQIRGTTVGGRVIQLGARLIF